MFRPSSANLTAIRQWFEENFRSRGELGASVSIWQSGVELLHLAAGQADRAQARPWTDDTLVPVWSATKGPAALCTLLALQEADLDLECPVAEVWPEFVYGGKQHITFSQLFSHRAGLSALDERVSIFNYDLVIEAIEHQSPLWEPGAAQGYHARTFGFLMDELVRRITGAETLGEYFREVFGSPLGLDFWIGLPTAQHERVATIYPGKLSLAAGDQPFIKAFTSPGSLTQRTFTSPLGLNSVQDFNQPETWRAGYASMGGVGSARALAQWYALLACGGRWKGREMVPSSLLKPLQKAFSEGDDLVLLSPIAFTLGFMKDPTLPETPDQPMKKLRQHYGPSFSAYGHPGAGGCLAFADPENEISFAYVMNQMETGALPGPKCVGMIERLYQNCGH